MRFYRQTGNAVSFVSSAMGALVLCGLLFACTGNVKPDPMPAVPTAESARELLSALNFRATIADLVKRMKGYAQSQIDEELAKETLNTKQMALMAEYEEKTWALFDEDLGWPRFEATAVATFQEFYTQQQIDSLTAFYHSDSGRSVVAKLPGAMSVFTRERVDEWEAIQKTRGDKAAEDTIAKEIGVVLKPAEVEGFCAFFASPIGKEIMARSPGMKEQLGRRWSGLANDFEVHVGELATDYQARMDAAAAAK